MYLRVTYMTSDQSRVDDVLATLRQVGQPIMRQSAGFQSYYFGIDRAAGRIAVVSTWDTQEHANVQFASDDLRTRLEALGVHGEQPQVYEVADQV